jgi:hypothetical protein
MKRSNDAQLTRPVENEFAASASPGLFHGPGFGIVVSRGGVDEAEDARSPRISAIA